jgi:hypothetical protein
VAQGQQRLVRIGLHRTVRQGPAHRRPRREPGGRCVVHVVRDPPDQPGSRVPGSAGQVRRAVGAGPERAPGPGRPGRRHPVELTRAGPPTGGATTRTPTRPSVRSCPTPRGWSPTSDAATARSRGTCPVRAGCPSCWAPPPSPAVAIPRHLDGVGLRKRLGMRREVSTGHFGMNRLVRSPRPDPRRARIDAGCRGKRRGRRGPRCT